MLINTVRFEVYVEIISLCGRGGWIRWSVAQKVIDNDEKNPCNQVGHIINKFLIIFLVLL